MRMLQRIRSDLDHQSNMRLTLSEEHPSIEVVGDSGDWGARHIKYNAPFDLGQEQNQGYRMPKSNGLRWLPDNLGND